MTSFGYLVSVLGIIGFLMAVTEVWAWPTARLKTVLWALAIAAAIALLFLPVQWKAPEGNPANFACGSVAVPKEPMQPRPTPSGEPYANLNGIEYALAARECSGNRKSTFLFALALGVVGVVEFVRQGQTYRRSRLAA